MFFLLRDIKANKWLDNDGFNCTGSGFRGNAASFRCLQCSELLLFIMQRVSIVDSAASYYFLQYSEQLFVQCSELLFFLKCSELLFFAVLLVANFLECSKLYILLLAVQRVSIILLYSGLLFFRMQLVTSVYIAASQYFLKCSQVLFLTVERVTIF